jgi:hypothetical protein
MTQTLLYPILQEGEFVEELPLRLALTEFKHIKKHVCLHGEEVHARKWKLYAATQDTA